MKLTKNRSGPNTSISSNIPEATDCESGVQEGPVEYYWSNRHYERCTRVGICLGSATGMVRYLEC